LKGSPLLPQWNNHIHFNGFRITAATNIFISVTGPT
jgi:hypothetical protein